MIDNDQIAADLLAYMARQDAVTQMLGAWASGTALGGPSLDGRYPLPTGPGTTTLVPCPDRLRVDAGRFGVRTITGAGPHTMVVADVGKMMRIGNGSATPNITVNLPAMPEGSQFMFRQLGSGRLVFAANGGGTLIHRQNYNRTAGMHALATAVCDSVTNGLSTWILGGDLAAA